MVKERTLVIGFLALLVILSCVFLLVKVSKHGNEISWDYDGDGSGSGSDSSSSSSSSEEEAATTIRPKCVDSSPETTSEETGAIITTPDPDTGEDAITEGPDDDDN